MVRWLISTPLITHSHVTWVRIAWNGLPRRRPMQPIRVQFLRSPSFLRTVHRTAKACTFFYLPLRYCVFSQADSMIPFAHYKNRLIVQLYHQPRHGSMGDEVTRKRSAIPSLREHPEYANLSHLLFACEARRFSAGKKRTDLISRLETGFLLAFHPPPPPDHLQFSCTFRGLVRRVCRWWRPRQRRNLQVTATTSHHYYYHEAQISGTRHVAVW